MRRINSWQALALLVLLLAGARTASAQQASLTGRIADKSDAAIVGATVKVTNLDTGIVRQSQTNSEGIFNVPFLQPGNYRVTVEANGFKTASREGLKLDVNQAANIGMVLEPGVVTETVQVSSDAPLLDSESPALNQVIESQQVANLPLNGRNYIQLATLSAGSLPTRGPTTSLAGVLSGNTNISANIAGGRDDSNSFLLDGVESRQPWVGSPGILPSIDVLQEFKIHRGLYSAEFGQATGIISVATKSGTNKYHGTLFEFVRNDKFDARNFFDAKKPPYRQNQFGGTLGWPLSIPKVYNAQDKTFFLFNYEGLRTRQAITQIGNYPDPVLLKGDFSGIATPIIDPMTGQQFDNSQCLGLYGGVAKKNVICPSRFSKVAANYIKYIPAPNRNVTGANYARAPSRHNDFDQVTVRVDHQFSSKDNFFARYSDNAGGQRLPGLAQYFGTISDFSGKNLAVQESHTFGANIVNIARFGYNRGTLTSQMENTPTDVGTEIGLQNLNLRPNDWGIPRMQIVGYSVTGQTPLNQGSTSDMYQVSDTLSVQAGSHHLLLGGDVRHYRVNIFQTLLRQGLGVFGPVFTGHAVADFLVGRVLAMPSFQGAVLSNTKTTNTSLFAQDDWKVTPRFTLNLGLRWEYNTPFVERNGREGFFDATVPGGVIRLQRDPKDFGFQGTSPLLTVGGVRPGVTKAFSNFAPRLGFAYNLRNDLVIRGGGGIFYGTGLSNDYSQFSQFMPPFIIAPTIAAGTPLDSLFPNVRAANYQLAGVGPFTTDPDAERPYMTQWGLSVQKSIGEFLVEVGYQGSHGVHLWERININQPTLPSASDTNPLATVQSRRPFPNFGDVLQASFREFSYYHALQTRFERRFRNGLGLNLTYVFSKSIDTTSGGAFSTSHQDMRNLNGEKGVSNFDSPHSLVFNHIYELPFGKGKKFLSNIGGFGDALLGGWQVNGIFVALPGLPFSVAAPADASFGGFYTLRANVSGNPNLSADQRRVERWFNTAAFSVPRVGTFGNSGRNIVRGPSYRTYDFSLFKNFKIKERTTVQFRAEAFNVFNRANFGLPGNTVGTPAFGRITSARDPRDIQFGLKLLF
jgi:outer membrane receptor protein involved in Fe transport